MLFFIGTLVYKVPIKRDININSEGIKWIIGEKEYSEEVSIKIKGKYNNYLLKNDIFNGSILIDGYTMTKELDLLEIEFENGIGDITYYEEGNGIPVLVSFGFIVCEPDFNKFIIGINEESKIWSHENGLLISYPSNNRDDAVKISKELIYKNNYLSKFEYSW